MTSTNTLQSLMLLPQFEQLFHKSTGLLFQPTRNKYTDRIVKKVAIQCNAKRYDGKRRGKWYPNQNEISFCIALYCNFFSEFGQCIYFW